MKLKFGFAKLRYFAREKAENVALSTPSSYEIYEDFISKKFEVKEALFHLH